MNELLVSLKKSLGDLGSTDASLDEYYNQMLNMAKSDLETEDISATTLATDFGKTAIVLYAEALIKGQDIASNPTLIYLKNKLSAITKGERYEKKEQAAK